jgi:hypothetical protein
MAKRSTYIGEVVHVTFVAGNTAADPSSVTIRFGTFSPGWTATTPGGWIVGKEDRRPLEQA